MAEEYDRWLQQYRYQDETAMNSLTDEQIKGLSELYDTIDVRGDAEPISAWLDAIPGAEARDQRGVYWPVFRLFSVFQSLAKKGLGPFNSNRVRFWVPDPPLDWTKLPENLQYLSSSPKSSADTNSTTKLRHLSKALMKARCRDSLPRASGFG